MIINYEFNYLNKNNFLIFFLEHYAKKSGLEYSITAKDEKINLYIKGEETKQVKFSDECMSLIPNSVFLAKSSVQNVEEIPKSDYEYNKSSFANITPKVIKEYLANNYTENEYGVFSEISVLKDDEFIDVTKGNYEELLNFCFLNLLHNQVIILKNKNFKFTIKAGYEFENSTFLMPTSFKSIEKIFAIDEKSMIALASFEKPILNQKLNSIFRSNHKNAPIFFDLKAASDFFMFLLCDKLFKDDMFFLSINIKDNFKPFKISVLENSFLVVNQGKFLNYDDKELYVKNSNKMAIYKQIANEFNIPNEQNIHIYLSKSKEDSIELLNKNSCVKLINFKKYNSFEEIKNEIISDEKGQKLYNNFLKNFGFPDKNIEKSDSFFSLFNIISKIIFNKDASYLLESAKTFYGKKGVRLDYFLKEKKEFDVCKFVKSGMSYKLAGVDDKLLSYGYIESLIHFLDDLLGDVKDGIGFNSTILTGNLFEENFISNLALKIITKDKNPKFSNYIGLEGN